MSSLRIVMAGPFGLSPKGTMAVRALPLARALAARGHQVKLVMPGWHTQEPPRLWHDEGVELEYVALGPWRGHASAPWIVHRMLAAAHAWRPDLIHAFKPKAYAGLLAWSTWQRRHRGGAPALVVDADDWEGRGGWEQVEPYPAAARALFRWQEHWGLTHHHGLTVASHALETLAWSLGAHPERVCYLPNGSTLPSTQPSARADRPTVLLYTRLAEFAPERAVAVLTQLAARVPELKVRVVGQALQPARDEAFDRAIVATGLASRVERLGWVPVNELPATLTACQVALCPLDDNLINRCRCSVKLADLVRLGIPVVADAVGEATSYIADGETGYCVPCGDESAMIDALARLLYDPALASRMGRAAQERYAARFDWEALAAVAEATYERALANR
ncbi:MAG: glycosyltransferase [Anaerolineales bacterium]